jgi:DNA mismatch repair protein MutL
VEETERGFRLVDPHALHERLLYDEILGRLTSGPLESQRLLFPVVLEVDREELAEFEERKDLLQAVGFEIAPFGPGTLALHAAPRVVPPASLPDLLRELLRELRAHDVAGSESAPDQALDAAVAAIGDARLESPAGKRAARRLVHGVAAALACKGAVKFGTALGRSDMQALLARREEARAACCPHGRPTALSITLEELDRRFGRSG